MNTHRPWLPHVTVAAVVERDGRFLCVEERTAEGLVVNQPAGHLEPGESLPGAAVREVLEETGYDFTPVAAIGIYQYRSPVNDITYLRLSFTGTVHGPRHDAVLDPAIVAVRWYSRAELAARGERQRSPMVAGCIDDYLAGHRIPLSAIRRL